eukprot:scaffold48719_cov76-Attheya_sp.AAC.5
MLLATESETHEDDNQKGNHDVKDEPEPPYFGTTATATATTTTTVVHSKMVERQFQEHLEVIHPQEEMVIHHHHSSTHDMLLSDVVAATNTNTANTNTTTTVPTTVPVLRKQSISASSGRGGGGEQRPDRRTSADTSTSRVSGRGGGGEQRLDRRTSSDTSTSRVSGRGGGGGERPNPRTSAGATTSRKRSGNSSGRQQQQQQQQQGGISSPQRERPRRRTSKERPSRRRTSPPKQQQQRRTVGGTQQESPSRRRPTVPTTTRADDYSRPNNNNNNNNNLKQKQQPQQQRRPNHSMVLPPAPEPDETGGRPKLAASLPKKKHSSSVPPPPSSSPSSSSPSSSSPPRSTSKQADTAAKLRQQQQQEKQGTADEKKRVRSMPSFRLGPKSLSNFLFTSRRWYQLSDEKIDAGSSRLVGVLEGNSSRRSLSGQTTTSDQNTLIRGNTSTRPQTIHGTPVKEKDMQKKSVRFAESPKLPSYWSSTSTSTTPTTMTTSPESQQRSHQRHRRRRCVTISVATFLCLAALVMISYVTYRFFETKNNVDDAENNTEPNDTPYMPSHCADIWQPLASSSSQLFLEDKSDRYKSLVHWAIRALEDEEDPTILPNIIPNSKDLSEQAESWAWPCSPRDLALSWLADMDPMQLWLPSTNATTSSSSSMATTSTHKLSQRYALALLFYSTSGHDRWISKTSWLSETSVCQWTGVICDPSSSEQAVGGGGGTTTTAATTISPLPNPALLPNTVVHIQLSRNGLEGTIPPEVKLLSHLGTFLLIYIYHTT